MLCENCHENPASIHVTKIVNGHREELSLCEACAKKLNLPLKSLSIQELLGGMLGGAQPVASEPDLGSCPACGFEYKAIQKDGRLGCPECYRTFREPLTQVLRGIHGSTAHQGKVPRRAQSALHEQRKLEALRREMSKAVQEENFERAAQLRDEIRGIEQQEGGERS